MNYNTFKTLLKKTKQKFILVALLIALVGAPFIVMGVKDGIHWGFLITGGVLTLLTLFLLMISIRDLSRINADELPILKAIRQGQKDYLVWMYVKEINTKVEGVQAGTSNNLVLINRQGKMEELVLNRKTSPYDIMDYLGTEFPDAHVGYSDDTRAEVSQLLGKKF